MTFIVVLPSDRFLLSQITNSWLRSDQVEGAKLCSDIKFGFTTVVIRYYV